MNSYFRFTLLTCVFLACFQSLSFPQVKHPYADNIVDTVYAGDGRIAYGIIIPGKPPENITGPLAEYTRSTVNLQVVPAFNWCFGCTATSAAMAAGYYDNNGYPNMYDGPENNGIMPQTNAAWSDTVINGETRHRCPLSATGIGLDGRTTRGHIEDYWISYGSPGPDPWDVNGWTEHTHGDCTGDYMKTNQWVNSGEGFNTDGSTTIYTWNDGSPMTATDLENENIDDYDGGYGLKLFYESRGYTVTTLFNQKIEEMGLTYGYTFEQYCDEIDAGRPVLIHVTDHTMIGYGYNDDGANEIIYLHDTWDWLDHQMDWGGSYSGLDHWGVTVCELQASDINVWTGDYNSYWANSSNWSLGHVPTSSEDVVIPDNSITCMVDVYSASCNNLEIYPGAVLRLMDETITINGDLRVHGEIEINSSPAEIIVQGYVYWENGSTIDINYLTNDFNPLFRVHGGWRYLEGSNVPMEKGIVYFTGTAVSNAYVWTRSPDSYFHHIRMEKAGGNVYHSSNSTETWSVEGNIYIDDGCTFRSSSSEIINVGGYINTVTSASHVKLGNGILEFSGNPSTAFKPASGDYVNNLRINTGSYTFSLGNNYTTTLDVNGFVSIQSGYFDPNGFTINVGGNWYNIYGPSRFIQAGTRVIFDGSGHQYIYDSEDFDTLESQCGAAIRLENSSTTVNVANYDWTAGGWDVLAGTLNVNNLLDIGLWGVWYLNAGGEINVVEESWLDLNGEIHIYGGTMSCTGNTGYWAWADNALIEMTAGTLDYTSSGIVLWGPTYTLTENISGGRIRVNGSFSGSNRSDFTPTGGMFEFYGTGDNTITQGAGNNFCFMEINKGSSTVTRDKNVNKAERSRGDIQLSDPRPDVFASEGGSRANTINLGSDLIMTDDLIISTGTLDVSSSNYSITLGGDWTNYVGDAGFNERQGEVRFNGALTADITTSETFYDLVMDKTYSNYLGLELNAGSTFTVLDDLRIEDGCIEMNTSCDLIITDSLVISADAGLNAFGDTGLEIWVGGHWYNYNTTYDAAGVGFNPGTSTVTFDGSDAQKVYTNASSEEFYDLVINKPDGVYFRPINDITVLDDLTITSGDWWDFNNYRNHYFYDDFTVDETNGAFYSTTQNTVRFMGTGDQYIDFPMAAGGNFFNVYINKIAPADRSNPSKPNAETAEEIQQEPVRDGSRAVTTYLANDLIALNGGYLYVAEGTLDLNNHYYRCTGNAYIYDNATLSIDENAWLEVGGGSDLRVYTGGTLEVIGSSGNEAMIEGHNDNEYDFYVYSGGTISADHAIFEDMGVLGVYILDGATVDPSHSFNNCTFRDGSATAGATLLRIENNQVITIDGASFPEATPDADYNVRKSAYDHGSVTFTNCTGDFAGPLYEYDTYGRIHWDGQGNWLGATSSDWNTASNWGFNYVPDLTTDVFIGSGCPNYPQVPGSLSIDYAGSFSYYCRSLEIDAGGELSLTSGSIYNYGDLIVNGILDIADDLNAYSGSVTDVYDTVYTGNQTGYVGRVNLNSGSVLNQFAGSAIFIETLYLHDGCYYNGSSGRLHVYNSGTYPATNSLIIQDDDSHLPITVTEAGTNVAPSSCTYDPDIYYLISYGDFSLNGYNVLTYYCDFYGDLNINGDTLTVTGNGPYFQNGAMLTMSSGMIGGGNNIVWYLGSGENVTGGTITVQGSFYDNDGLFSPTGGIVKFITSEPGIISGSTGFYNVSIDKPGSILESGSEGDGATISIANDLDIYDGEFELNTGTILDIDGDLRIFTGAVLDADDAYPIEIMVENDWFNYNTSATGFLAGTGSIVTFNGSYSVSALQEVREKSEFNKVVVNSGQVYVRPSGTGNVYIKADTIDVQSGRLNVSGYRVEADERLSISDELEMTSSSDTLIVHDIIWESGSNDIIDNGKIFVNGNWRWENGTNAYISSGNTVTFNASSDRYIYSYEPDAAFYNLEVENTGSSWLWISSYSTQDVQVLNNMNVRPGGRFVVNENDLTVDGNLDIMSGGWMWMYTDGDLEVATDFGLNGSLVLDGGGNVLVHGMFDINSTGYLNMSGGVFCCDAPYSAPRGFCSLDGQLDLAGTSVLEVLYNHIQIGSTFIDNITGGTIRVGGTFVANIASTFQPSGGTLEYSGGVGGGCYIQMANDNWFNNLLVDGGVSWSINGSQAVHIKKDLTIESGGLNAFNDTIYLGDDWINNVGATGFSEGTGKVILNGTHAVDVQQINGETFYDLENRNTANHVEIAGNTTVSNNYYGGAGGAPCETFVTAPLFDIQDTLKLDQGILALSASAPTVTTGVFDQGGTLQLTDGSFTAYDLIEDYLLGDYVLHNGLIELHQGPTDYFDFAANIEIHNGNFNLIGGNDVSYWAVGGSPLTFEMTGGVLTFEDVGIRLTTNDYSYDISGGSIRTYGDFTSNPGVSVFDPSGGSVQMLGNTNSQISLGSGSFFHDLVIEKYGATGVNCSSDLLIKNELRLKEGEFNTNGYQVDVIP